MFEGTKCGGEMGMWVQDESQSREMVLSFMLGMGIVQNIEGDGDKEEEKTS